MHITSYDLELSGMRPELGAVSETECPDVLTDPGRIAELACGRVPAEPEGRRATRPHRDEHQMVPLGLFEVSHGTVSASIASPREVFIRLLLGGAVQFVILHNHPSGNTEPSREDDSTTERLKEAGKMMNLPLTDHIIGTDRAYYSGREHGKI